MESGGRPGVAVMKIVTNPNKILNQPTRKVVKFDDNLHRTVREMEEILRNQRNPEGVGLSANQVGLDLRLAVVRLNPDEQDSAAHFLTIINPEITSRSTGQEGEYEGCLSRIFQHEIDHLDGKLITARSAGPFLTETELEEKFREKKSG